MLDRRFAAVKVSTISYLQKNQIFRKIIFLFVIKIAMKNTKFAKKEFIIIKFIENVPVFLISFMLLNRNKIDLLNC